MVKIMFCGNSFLARILDLVLKKNLPNRGCDTCGFLEIHTAFYIFRKWFNNTLFDYIKLSYLFLYDIAMSY